MHFYVFITLVSLAGLDGGRHFDFPSSAPELHPMEMPVEVLRREPVGMPFNITQGCDPVYVRAFVYIDDTDGFNQTEFQRRWEQYFNQITRLFPMEECIGGTLRISPLTTTGSPVAEEIGYDALARGFNIYSPPVEYLRFKRRLKELFEQYAAQPAMDKGRSFIYEPVCRGLQELSQSPADRKVVILFSDLLENAASGSLYGYRGSGADLLRRWEQHYGCTLPDLSTVELYVVNFRSESSEEDILRSRKFWSSVFADQGVRAFSWGSNLRIH